MEKVLFLQTERTASGIQVRGSFGSFVEFSSRKVVKNFDIQIGCMGVFSPVLTTLRGRII